MKRSFILALAVISLILAGCSNSSGGGSSSSSSGTYTLEQGSVSKEAKNTAVNWPASTYSERRGVRDGLYNGTPADYQSMTVYEVNLKAWLMNIGKTESQANQIISDTNSIGNYVLLYDDPAVNTKAWCFYIVKN